MGHGDWKDMFRGVEKNDLALVQYYIRGGIDVNFQHPEYMTSLLIESIRLNHVEMMKLLLENGASPVLKEDFSNKSPMTIAKELNNKEAVEILHQFLGVSESAEKWPFYSRLLNLFRRKRV